MNRSCRDGKQETYIKLTTRFVVVFFFFFPPYLVGLVSFCSFARVISYNPGLHRRCSQSLQDSQQPVLHFAFFILLFRLFSILLVVAFFLSILLDYRKSLFMFAHCILIVIFDSCSRKVQRAAYTQATRQQTSLHPSLRPLTGVIHRHFQGPLRSERIVQPRCMHYATSHRCTKHPNKSHPLRAEHYA